MRHADNITSLLLVATGRLNGITLARRMFTFGVGWGRYTVVALVARVWYRNMLETAAMTHLFCTVTVTR